MAYLLTATEIYRLPNEQAVEVFLQELKADKHFEIVKYSSTKREAKSKGEVVDEWIRFSVTKAFNMEKEPTDNIKIHYTKD